MVAVDTKLNGLTITLRPSQVKFESTSTAFEVASAFTRPMPAQLNRPLVSLLAFLGVETSVLLKLQARTIKAVKDSRATMSGTAVMLRRSSLGSAFGIPALFLAIDGILGLQLSTRRGAGRFISPFLTDALDIAVDDALYASCRVFALIAKPRHQVQNPLARGWLVDARRCRGRVRYRGATPD